MWHVQSMSEYVWKCFWRTGHSLIFPVWPHHLPDSVGCAILCPVHLGAVWPSLFRELWWGLNLAALDGGVRELFLAGWQGQLWKSSWHTGEITAVARMFFSFPSRPALVHVACQTQENEESHGVIVNRCRRPTIMIRACFKAKLHSCARYRQPQATGPGD